MKRRLLLFVVFASVAVFASAQESAGRFSDLSRLEQFHRNQTLVRHLVEEGLELAAAGTPLDRADHVQKIANVLADEIDLAAQNKEGDRAKELCTHLKDLLTQGVAGNLSAARIQTTSDSAMQPQLIQRRDQVDSLLGPLEGQLRRLGATDQDDMSQAANAIQDARQKVREAVLSPAIRKKS